VVNAGNNITTNAGSAVAFAGSVFGGTSPYTYSWNFGDGTSESGNLDPSHVYANPGAYSATLTVTDASGYTGNSSAAVTVNDVAPTVTLTDPPATVGTPVSFSAVATDLSPAVQAAGFSYSWNFGDGGTATGASASHTFTAAGTYTVTVTATDEYGKSGTANATMVVTNPSSTATTYTLSAPNPATGSIGTASGAFTIALPSGYTVTSPVTVTPSDGGAEGTFTPTQVTLSNTITSATFTYTPASAGTITITTSNNGGLTDPSPTAINVTSSSLLFHDTFPGSTPSSAWSFNAGTWQVNNGVMSQTAISTTDPTKAMITNQTYPSNLMITAEVEVNSWTAGDLARAGVGLDTNPNSGRGYNLLFHGTNAVQFLNDGVVWGNSYTFSWQTGIWYWFQLEANNGTLYGRVWPVGSAEPQSWMFQQTGWTGNAGAPALNGGSGGSTDSFADVSVTTANVQPDTASAGSALIATVGIPTNFSQATATGIGPLTYAWNFGDGGTATGAINPTYTYASPGTYTATLTVTDALGIPATSTVTVTVAPPPTVNLSAPSTGTTGTSIALSASATDANPAVQASGYTYLWSFGDGTTATGSSVTHTYVQDALYTITVSATAGDGPVGTASAQVNVFPPGEQGNTSARYYNLQGPSASVGGVGIPSGSFTVSLPNGRFVSSPVTVIPNDGGAGGTFTPSSVVLSNSNPMATFTYIAATVGTITISTTDNGGLTNPAPAVWTAQSLVTTYTVSGPASGTVASSSSFTVTLGAGWLNNPVAITPSASNGDGTFSPSSITLTNSNRSATFTYTPQLYDVRNIATTNNENLTDPAPTAFVSEVQLGSSGTAPSGNQAPDLGGFGFFVNGAWWQAIGSPASNYGIDPNSGSLISDFGSANVRVDFSTTTANGGNSMYGMPINVVPGNQSLLPVTLGAYASESDPGPSPYYAGMSIENWYSPTGTPPTQAQLQSGADYHGLVMVRNESTGGIAYLYEGYSLYSNDGGNTWGTTGSQAVFNLITGAPRPEFWTSTDAAGLPISPLLVNYGEALLAADGGPAIDHPLRVSISAALSMNAFVWPARHGVYSGNATTGLPMGARLQLTQAWYDANINNFDPIDRAIVTAMYQYGVIVADLASNGGIWLEGTNDQRWTTSELNALGSIPDSAFQVLNTIQPAVNFTGPTTGQVGVPQTYTITYPNTADSNFSTQLWVSVSANGAPATYIDEFTLNDANRGPFTFTYTPPTTGNYQLQVNYGGNDWILPAPINFTATAVPRTVTSTQSGDWSNPATWGGQTPPGAGDIAVIDNNVTITQNTTIGDGSASTVLTIASGASLTITGATFTIRGNCVVQSQPSFRNVLTINPSGSTPGGIEFDGNSGVTPVFTQGDFAGIASNGTSSANCFIMTKSGSAGGNAYFATSSDPSNWHTGYWACTYTTFSSLGSSTQAAITCQKNASAPFTFDHCTITSCGTLPSLETGYDATAVTSFTNCTWENSLNLDACIDINASDALTTGTRLINACLFLNRPLFYAPNDYTITNNYFGDSLNAGDTEALWAEFNGNFLTRTNDDGDELVSAGSMTNNYFYTTQTASVYVLLNSSHASSSISYNVAEYAGPGNTCLFQETEETQAGNVTYTYSSNIAFCSSTGSWSPVLGFSSNPANPYQNITDAYHNTFLTQGTTPTLGNTMELDSVQALKANVLYNSGSSTGVYAYATSTNMGVLLTDEAPASAFQANSSYGMQTVVPGTFTTVAPIVSGATTCTNGAVYYSPMSGAKAPGAGDLANTNPDFFDSTRSLATWDSRVMGGPGTAADAMSLLQANPTLVTSSLLPWIRAGYAPTNPALENASYSGDPSTADANGNAWPGGGPGIGAMGWVSSSAPAIVLAPSTAPVALPVPSSVSQSMTSSVGIDVEAGAELAPGQVVVINLATSTPASAAVITPKPGKAVPASKSSSPKLKVTRADPASHLGVRSRTVALRSIRDRLFRVIPGLMNGE
jgi:PKD repeat protein